MTTITKLLIASVLAMLMVSCDFDFKIGGVKGDGNVITMDRSIDGEFDEIKVSRGLDVYLTQSDTESISVQADENLHDIIMTKIEGNVLKIYADENISWSSAQKVNVSFKTISKITATSGSDVFATNTITSDHLYLSTTSGSDMELEVNSQSIDCKSTSGSDLKLSGKTINLNAKASSGSEIEAGNLYAETSRVKASSGAEIMVNTSKELYAEASSGGDISYRGNPEKIKKSDGASGSISKE